MGSVTTEKLRLGAFASGTALVDLAIITPANSAHQ